MFGYNLPCLVRRGLVAVARAFLGERVASVIEVAKKYSSDEIDQILREKSKFEKAFEERWRAEGLDAMISPVYYHSAYKTKEGRNELALQADYTQLWNVLSYPAGVVPVTEVLTGEDRPENY